MAKPIWHSDSKGAAREAFVAFSAGRDVVAVREADHDLVPCDVWTNAAHAAGLLRIGVYTNAQIKRLLKALRELESQWRAGAWKLDPALEDVHINIESWLTEQCGEEIGGRLHSGRSRNDQVAADMAQYAREVILMLCTELTALAAALIHSAQTYAGAVMPGYTHHRKATITTWGHWCAAYAQGVLRDVERYRALYARVNQCPLGAAASYGTTWPLDRALTARLLGFDAPRENTLDAVDSRGEAETEIVQAMALSFKRLSAMSQGLILFSTDEFGFLGLPSSFTTGSSIMPQKRNPDFAEAIKAKASAVTGYGVSLLSTNLSNFFGYNKDAQWTKYLFMDAVREASGAAAILAEVVSGLTVREDRMREAAERGFLNAVDVADALAQTRAIPFRKTYKLMSEAVGRESGDRFTMDGLNAVLSEAGLKPLSESEFKALADPVRCVMQRDHAGAPHPKRVKSHAKKMSRQLKTNRAWLGAERKRLDTARRYCLSGEWMK
ncbi:MAG: argininosuccinate lyase [bacterium]|nr:argininosuccinate lyase [bacterium]